MSILLIGCGYWGQNWAKTLARLGALRAVCDPRPEVLAQLKTQYPDVGLYTTVEEALQDPAVRGVVVATPVFTHLDVASTCLKAGKDVLVEKPLTVRSSDAEQLVQLAASCNQILAVGHLLMYHPALQKLKQLMQEGELGEILSVQCNRINLGKVRAQEDAWWSLAPHDLSILSMLFGEAFGPLTASALYPLNTKVADEVYASFETESGRRGSIRVSWLQPLKQHQTVVIGSEKIAVFEDTLPHGQKLALLPYTIQGESVEKGVPDFVDYDAPDELLALEAKGFLNAIETRIPPVNDGQNGLQVVRMLEAVQNLYQQQSTLVSTH